MRRRRAVPARVVARTNSCVFAFTYPYVGIATTLLYYDLLQSRPAEEPSLQPGASILRRQGRLAQLGERLPYKQEVAGSSPAPPNREKPC